MGANAQTEVPTFTASQVLTAAQMNNSARTGVPVFATTVTRDAAFGGAGEKTLAEGQLAYIEASDVVQYYDGAAWVSLQKIGVASVATSQSTTSTSFTDLATVGPAVTITTGTTALVTIQTLGDTLSNRQIMSFAVSGATTIAAGTYQMSQDGFAPQTSQRVAMFYVTGLTAGSNTFTTKYKSSDGNTIPFAQRIITVLTL